MKLDWVRFVRFGTRESRSQGPQTLIHGDFHTENLLFLEGSGAGSRDRDLLRDAIMVSEGKIAPDAPPPATLSNSDTAELLGAESGDVATGPPPSPQWEVERVTKWPSEPHPNDGGDPGRVRNLFLWHMRIPNHLNV